MKTQIRWLRGEIDRWVREGFLGEDQASRIRALYPEPGERLPWATIIFAGLGAVILGLGVILIFAYNWERMPRGVKLAAIFASLIAAHGTGIWLFLRKPRLRAVGESLCLLGTMLFGAGIWLVAQIYHIEEHFPNGFLFWGLGALAMAWALPSIPQGMLAAAALTVWCGTEVVEFRNPVHLAPPLIAVALGALVWRRRSLALLAAVIPAFSLTVLFNLGALKNDFIIGAVLSLAALFVAASVLVRLHGKFPESWPIFAFYGWATYAVTLYVLTFHDAVREFLYGFHRKDSFSASELAYHWGVFGPSLAAWALVAWLAGKKAGEERSRAVPLDFWLVPLTLIAYQLFPFGPADLSLWAVAGLFNLIFLGHAVALMARGCREGLLGPTILGALLFSALALARYFDLFESLLARGLTFLIVGGILIAEGILFSRRRKALAQGKEGA